MDWMLRADLEKLDEVVTGHIKTTETLIATVNDLLARIIALEKDVRNLKWQL